MPSSSFRSLLLPLSLCAWLALFDQTQASSSTSAHVRRQYDTGVSQIDAKAERHRLDFFQYVTRPDIDAPRWKIQVYDKDALAPGYWFASMYEYIDQTADDAKAWCGPSIYDQDGELVWSGAPLFHGYNIDDFHADQINGTPVLTGIHHKQRKDVVVNSNYEIIKEITIEEPQKVNIHGFHTVENGTRSLAMTMLQARPSDPGELGALGFDESCVANYEGFEERDTSTWEITFSWNAKDRIRLEESNQDFHCRAWIYLHGNAVDKFPDGDYLFSGRATDTLYKISGTDGSIVWRLGGNFSNFTWIGDDGHFSGQHFARVQEQNATHIILSFLDNAYRPLHPSTVLTNPQSRGMIVALRTDTQPMTAQVLHTYNHPRGGYAPGRGSFQILDNGNAFSGWWTRGLISEHAPDGTLLMEADWTTNLRSYRAYKMPWVGHPTQPPDVYARAVVVEDAEHRDKQTMQTAVYVSWNGATEVARWRLLKTTAHGKAREQVAELPRQGFETMMTYDGYASYVVVQGIDREGNVLGESAVFTTIPSPDKFAPAVLKEQHWIAAHAAAAAATLGGLGERVSPVDSPVAAFFFGLIVSLAGVGLVRVFVHLRRRRNQHSWRPWNGQSKASYEAVSVSDFGEETLVEDASFEDEKAKAG